MTFGGLLLCSASRVPPLNGALRYKNATSLSVQLSALSVEVISRTSGQIAYVATM